MVSDHESMSFNCNSRYIAKGQNENINTKPIFDLSHIGEYKPRLHSMQITTEIFRVSFALLAHN